MALCYGSLSKRLQSSMPNTQMPGLLAADLGPHVSRRNHKGRPHSAGGRRDKPTYLTSRTLVLMTGEPSPATVRPASCQAPGTCRVSVNSKRTGPGRSERSVMDTFPRPWEALGERWGGLIPFSPHGQRQKSEALHIQRNQRGASRESGQEGKRKDK